MNLVLIFLWHLMISLRAQAAESLTPPPYNETVDNGTFGFYPVRTYATAEQIESPQTNFLQWDDQCDDGLLYFVTPRGWGLPTPGPMLLDSRGELIWAKHFANDYGGQAYDFTVQKYRGREYLTFWLGDDRVRGHGSGFYYMLNSSYDIVHKVGAAHGLPADLHEFLLTPDDTALVTVYDIFPRDVTDFRTFDPNEPEDQDPNYIWDCLFQEVDLDTGNLLFQWRASDHVNLKDTYHGIGPGGTKNDPFDWFHLNSIEKDELGNYLISARYTHSITYVHGKTGEIIWTLGGRSNMFMDLSDGFGLNFAWQHDARFLPTDTFPNIYNPPVERPGHTTKLLTLFDNAAEDQHYEYGLPYSRGLLLELTYPTPVDGQPVRDLPSRGLAFEPRDEGFDRNAAKVQEINGTSTDYTVRVIKSYENPKGVRSSSQGSVQVIPRDGQDPKVLVSYGLNAVWTEFDSSGAVLCDAHYGADTSWERGDIQSYRIYKLAWTGAPESRPSVDISDDDAEVYVSWNGATDVVDWILQCSQTDSEDEQDWADVVRVGKRTFESVITIPENGLGDARYLRVIAIGEAGRRLDHGTSATIDRGLLAAYFPFLDGKLPSRDALLSPLKVFLVFLSFTSFGLILFEAYRRYLSWRMGRPGAGPLRWRKGATHRLLADA